jgi:hypothetical protein
MAQLIYDLEVVLDRNQDGHMGECVVKKTGQALNSVLVG